MKGKLKFYVLILSFFCQNAVFSQSVNHWETIVKTGDNCRYKVPTSNIGVSWISKDFNDGSWKTGVSGIGFGDGDDNTTISKGTTAVYIRYNFEIKDLSQIESLLLDIDYDDGFIAYLNGTEVARDNVDNPVSWNMELNGLHEAALYKGETGEIFFKSAPSKQLKTGQ